MDELAVSSDDIEAQMLDGEQVLSWVRFEHKRIRASLEDSVGTLSKALV